METGTIITLIVISLIACIVGLFIYKMLTKSEPLQPLKLSPRIPVYDGTTTDSTEDHHDPRVMNYSLNIGGKSGPTIVFAHDELTATEALMQMFRYDKANKMSQLSEKEELQFITLAKMYDSNGWPKLQVNTDVESFKKAVFKPNEGRVPLTEADSKADLEDKPRPDNPSKEATYLQGEKYGSLGVISSCCKVRLFDLEFSGARRCPKCNKFCKAI